MRRGVTCAALLAAISAAPGDPAAQPRGGVLLEWTRAEGAGECISAEDLAARVEERLGRAVFVEEPAAETTIAGTVLRAAASPRWRGTLRVTRADGTPESREITSDAPTCRPLSDAMTLVLSLLVAPLAPPDLDPGEPEPGPAGLNPGEPGPIRPDRAVAAAANPNQGGGGASGTGAAAPGTNLGTNLTNLNLGRVGTGGAQPAGGGEALGSQGVAARGGVGEANLGEGVGGAGGEPWRWGVAAGSVLQAGALPGVALGPRVVAKVVAPLVVPVSLEVQGVWLLGAEVVVPEGRAEFRTLMAGLAICPELLTGARLGAGLCAGVDAGRVLVRGHGFKPSYGERRAYGQAGVGAWISLRIHRWLTAGASAGGAMPLVRHRFTFEERATGVTHVLHHTGAVAAQGEVHLGVEFP